MHTFTSKISLLAPVMLIVFALAVGGLLGTRSTESAGTVDLNQTEVAAFVIQGIHTACLLETTINATDQPDTTPLTIHCQDDASGFPDTGLLMIYNYNEDLKNGLKIEMEVFAYDITDSTLGTPESISTACGVYTDDDAGQDGVQHTELCLVDRNVKGSTGKLTHKGCSAIVEAKDPGCSSFVKWATQLTGGGIANATTTSFTVASSEGFIPRNLEDDYDSSLAEDGAAAGTCGDDIDNGGGDGFDENDPDCIPGLIPDADQVMIIDIADIGNHNLTNTELISGHWGDKTNTFTVGTFEGDADGNSIFTEEAEGRGDECGSGDSLLTTATSHLAGALVTASDLVFIALGRNLHNPVNDALTNDSTSHISCQLDGLPAIAFASGHPFWPVDYPYNYVGDDSTGVLGGAFNQTGSFDGTDQYTVSLFGITTCFLIPPKNELGVLFTQTLIIDPKDLDAQHIGIIKIILDVTVPINCVGAGGQGVIFVERLQGGAENSFDSDNDGCPNWKELGSLKAQGGLRDAWNYWDWLDIDKDGGVSLSDFLAVLRHFGTNGTPVLTMTALTLPEPATGTYWVRADRGDVLEGGDIWDTGPPDGGISLGDFLAVLRQFGNNC